MDRKVLTQIQIGFSEVRPYSACFIMTGFKNNERNNDRKNVSSVLENKHINNK